MTTGAVIMKKSDQQSQAGKVVQLPDMNDPEIQNRLNTSLNEKADAKSNNNTCGSMEPDLQPPTYLKEFNNCITETDVWQSVMSNEDGDTRLFVTGVYNQYLYDHSSGTWYYWNDHYWREDVLSHRYRKIMIPIRIYTEQKERELYKAEIYKKNDNKEKADKHIYMADVYQKRIDLLHTQHRKNNILIAATQGKNSLGISGEEWDRDPYLLGVKNGVLNLISSAFDDSGSRQRDYIKTISPTVWKGINEPCPEWEKFLNQTFYGRPEMVSFLQRLFGYSLRGDTPDHIFPIFFGAEGRNGKGTIFETLKYVLGKLAYKAPSEFLMTKTNSQQSADAPSATLMKLRGARLVWCSESNEGDRIDSAKLKELVGGDTISARAPYGKKQIEFSPTHTLFIMTNSKPRMSATDPALWRRIWLVEFKMVFVDNPDPKKPNQVRSDKTLKGKLKAESSGILAWMFRGALDYQNEGLNPPAEVLEATQGYRDEEDIVGHFVEEYCEVGDSDNRAYRTKSKELYDGYKEWCKEAGHFPMAKNKFRNNLLTKFEEKLDGSERIRKFCGIALSSSFSSY